MISLHGLSIGRRWATIRVVLAAAASLGLFMRVIRGRLPVLWRGVCCLGLLWRHCTIAPLGGVLDRLVGNIVICYATVFRIARKRLIARVIIIWFGVLEYNVPGV